MKVTEHLIDRLAAAEVEAPRREMVAVQPITVRRETRMSLFQHPPAKVTFPALTLGKNATLRFGCGLKQACWDRVRSAFVFRVALRDGRGRRHQIFRRRLDVRRKEESRRWVDAEVDLSRFAGQAVTLTFTTSTPLLGSTAYGWLGWSDPVIEHEVAAAPRTARRDSHHHVLLITSDALRADHLGCYGHPTVKTPHVDALARDGALFTHARTQSSATLAAYASLLTGRHTLEHGLLTEWGRMRPGVPALPEIMRARGYHTVIAASEAEICEDERGLVSLFDESVPCLAVPAQSGEITTRQFTRWLDRRPDQPFFAWLQFFDTHPPATPPEPFRSLYYDGNPTDPARAHRPEAVAQIRGVETVVDFERVLNYLPQGRISATLIARLQDAADNLTGRNDFGPDLAAHLKALGADARRGLSERAFGEWLAGEADKLRGGAVTPELLDWLRRVQPMLMQAEAEIISWLDGVTDFRYPLAQYQSEVSYLDHHVGQLVAALKEQGIYEQTTVLFTSPHGELLGEHGIYFHHHTLMEEALRIPAIIKPADAAIAGTGRVRGVRIDGVCDQIDLLPTLLEALGIECPAGLSGLSRWAQVVSGAAIPAHDSIAADYNGVMFALARPPYVFLKAIAPHFISAGWEWPAGRGALFELREPMDYTHDLGANLPDVVRQMESRLDEWMRHYDSAMTSTTGRKA